MCDAFACGHGSASWISKICMIAIYGCFISRSRLEIDLSNTSNISSPNLSDVADTRAAYGYLPQKACVVAYIYLISTLNGLLSLALIVEAVGTYFECDE